MIAVVVVCALIAILIAIQLSLPKPKPPSLEATLGINYDFSPLQEAWKVSLQTGEHYGNVFLRDLRSDTAEQEIMALRAENERLKAALADASRSIPPMTAISPQIDRLPFKEKELKTPDSYGPQSEHDGFGS